MPQQSGTSQLFHILGNILILHPDSPLVTPNGDALLPLSSQILIPDRAGFTQLVIFQREVQLRCEAGFDIIGKNAGEQNPGYQQNQKHGANHTEYSHQHGGECIDRVPAEPENPPGSASLFQLFFRSGVLLGHRIISLPWFCLDSRYKSPVYLIAYHYTTACQIRK